MRRTLILGAVGTIALTIGLGVSATLASGATLPSAPSGPTTMAPPDAMTTMMSGDAMANMMDSNAMSAMHDSMHAALSGSLPADVLAACDATHSSMASGASSMNAVDDTHTAHHTGARP